MSVSPYYLADGTKRWRARVTLPDGRRTDRRGFTTKTAARKWEAEVMAGVKTVSNTKPLRDYADDLRARIKKLAPGTIDVYLPAIDNHIIPYWGGWKAGNVTRQDIQRWLDNEGFGRSVAARNLSLLRQLLDCAGIDPSMSPAAHVKKPKAEHKENIYLTWDQLELLASVTRTEQHKTLVLFLGTCGPRWGEAAGLRAKDLSPNDLSAHIWQTASVLRNEVVLGPPKNGHDRWISVPEFVMDRLEFHRGTRRDSSPVFLHPNGGYLRRPKGRSWLDGAKQRAHKEDSEFPLALRLHDLRHTAASLMIANGATVKDVQYQLGHKYASETLDTYADRYREDLSRVTGTFDTMWARGQNVGTDKKSGA